MATQKQARSYPPEYVSVETLAYLLDCSVETIESHVRTGILPAPRRLGRLARWRFADVEAALDGLDGQSRKSPATVIVDNGVLATGDDPFLAGVKAVGAK